MKKTLFKAAALLLPLLSPTLSLAQNKILNAHAQDGPDYNNIFWLKISSDVLKNMYLLAQPIATEMAIDGGSATLTAEILGSGASVLSPSNTPTFGLAGFGLTGQYSGAGSVALYSSDFTGSSRVTLNDVAVL